MIDALIASAMGYPDQAVRQMQEGLALARDLDHRPTLTHALWTAAELHQMRREPQKVEEFVSVVLQLLGKHGSAVTVANATMLRGWAGVMQGNNQEGLTVMREGLAAWRETGSKYHAPYRLARAAEAYLVAGELDDGLLLLAEASGHTGDFWLAPELRRLNGELLLQAGRRAEAEEYLAQALDVATEQNARLLELRAAMSLARLWRDQGKRDEARELLAPVYGWFTEGFDTLDLKEAKALMEQLTP